MPYNYSWKSDSTEPGIVSGMVTFKVEGEDYEFHLPSLDKAIEIQQMLDAAFDSGKLWAAMKVEGTVLDVMQCLGHIRYLQRNLP